MTSARSKKVMRIHRQEATKLINLRYQNMLRRKVSSCGTIYGYSFFSSNAGLHDRFYLAGPSTNKKYVKSLRGSKK